MSQIKVLGDSNQNGQQLVRKTDESGTDYNAKVWILKCAPCGCIYGCNSTDAWQRKCPECQGGAPGLKVPPERDGEGWTRDEHVIAFHLYNQIPFGTIHMRNPKIIELASMLGRSVGSVSYKLANFARLDPALKARGIRGMSRGAKGEEQIWSEFSKDPEKLAFECARLTAVRTGKSLESFAELDETELPQPGLEREAIVKLRVNQNFFRQRVLSAYEFKCCVTGVGNPALLVASHIVPWAADAANRLNPRNGLCLNALHDRIFDRGLMWIDPKMHVRLSPKLCERSDKSVSVDWLLSFDGKRLVLPKKFQPASEFLAKHAASWGYGNA